MARGDQARKAAHRQAVATQAAEESAYQRKIVQLTAENRELRERLAQQERSAKQTERRLRAERDEGVGPQVEALRLQLNSAERRHREQVQRIFDAAAAVIRLPGVKLVQSDVVALAEALGRTWAELAGPQVGPRARRRIPAKVGHANLGAYELGYLAGQGKDEEPA